MRSWFIYWQRCRADRKFVRFPQPIILFWFDFDTAHFLDCHSNSSTDTPWTLSGRDLPVCPRLTVTYLYLHSIPAFAIDAQLKISVVEYEDLISLAWYGITEQTSLTVWRIHPQTHCECRQTAHAREVDHVIDSFFWKIQGVIWRRKKHSVSKIFLSHARIFW